MKVKLKDPATVFVDPETGFSVTGDQTVEIDSKARKGKLTLDAIKHGGLIEVSREPKGGSKSGGKNNSDLPEDFPARAALIEGGFDSLEKVNGASDEDLIAVKGVGEKTVVHIRDAAK